MPTTPDPSPQPVPARGPLRHFRRDNRGATAVEFGIVALPFFVLLFAMIEIGLVFFANFTLDNAVEQAARLIRTGQAQEKGFDADRFKEEICGRVYGLLSCADGLRVDVRKFDRFANVSLPPALNEDGELRDDFLFAMGNSGEIVVVRAFYEFGLLAKLPGAGLGNMANGSRLLSATAAFRNEPFDQ